MDNEKWAHRVHVEPFSMARTPVTVAQFAEFVEAGGYKTDSLWSEQGLAWRHKTEAAGPVYCAEAQTVTKRRIGAGWYHIAETADHPDDQRQLVGG